MKTLRKVDLGSLARIVYLVDLCVLLVTAVPFALFVTLTTFATKPNPWGPMVMAGSMLVLHPLIAAIVAALAGALYNFLAPRVGGIQFDLE